MNKGELVDAVAQDARITKGEALAAVDSVVENVKKALKKGKKVTLGRFWNVFDFKEVSTRRTQPSDWQTDQNSGQEGGKVHTRKST